MSAISIMATSNGIAPPGPLTNISGWENFKEEMDMYFVVVKEDDDKTKLITLLYQGGSELRRVWKTVKPGTAETTEIYEKSIALLDIYFLPKKILHLSAQSLEQPYKESVRGLWTTLLS